MQTSLAAQNLAINNVYNFRKSQFFYIFFFFRSMRIVPTRSIVLTYPLISASLIALYAVPSLTLSALAIWRTDIFPLPEVHQYIARFVHASLPRPSPFI